VLLAGLAAGCAPAPEASGESADQYLASTNGLTMVNGLTMTNGLTMINGLTMTNGLAGDGLVSGTELLNTDQGRTTVSYMVRCALPAGHSITKQDDNGVSYTFAGAIGVAPEWEWGVCYASECQQQVTACMLAHINTTGAHIPLWLDGDSTAIGWDQDAAYPYEEGSFFGNIFVSPPQAFYCNGKDFDVGVVPGRIGAGQGDAPYVDPFNGNGYCKDHCTPADIPHQDDGYKACIGYNHVVTVWRNPDPSTIAATATSSASTSTSSTFAGTRRRR
jgi:hypothetical protein